MFCMQSIVYCSRRLLSLSSILVPQPSLSGFAAARWSISRASTLLATRKMADEQEPPSKKKPIRIGRSTLQENISAVLLYLVFI